MCYLSIADEVNTIICGGEILSRMNETFEKLSFFKIGRKKWLRKQIERKEEEIANCRKKIFWKLDLITWQDFYQIILQIPGCKISAYLIKEYDQSVPMVEIEDHVSKIEFQYCENMELLQRDWKEMEEVSLDEVDAISIANIMYSLEKVNPAIVDQFYQLIYEQKVSKM